MKLAARRHFRDLETGAARGLSFDATTARRALDLYRFLRHSKGEWAGQRINLSPFQRFKIGSIYGWKRADGTRRFRIAYSEEPRKNGKSTEAAGIGIGGLVADDEPGAEVYSAATKRDQAKIVFDEARRMVLASPALRKRLGVLAANLNDPATHSKFEPLGADADSLDGLNASTIIIDELHAHKTRSIWDVLGTATGSRRQPLIYVITTAGYDRNSICWEQHDYACKVLEGVVEDDAYFAYIATVDEGDDHFDEATWRKANPNYGISCKTEKIREAAERAKAVPGQLNAFLRLHLNVWTEQASRWLPMEAWDECGEAVDPDSLKGRDCYAGLDLSSKIDLSALALVFPPATEGERWKVLIRFWMPKNNIRGRLERDRVDYAVWIRQGLIEATEGNVVDYRFIRKRINELAERYVIKEIAFDRWNATQLSTELSEEDGFAMVEFGQGFASMAAPTKEFEKLVVGRQLAHGANAVLRWMASNISVRQDPAGNMKPDKEKSGEKIDGIVAILMGLARAVANGGTGRSVYETRGVISL